VTPSEEEHARVAREVDENVRHATLLGTGDQ
jgi:hypothetical protein